MASGVSVRGLGETAATGKRMLTVLVSKYSYKYCDQSLIGSLIGSTGTRTYASRDVQGAIAA